MNAATDTQSRRSLTDVAGILLRTAGLELDIATSGRLASCVTAAARAHGIPVVDYAALLESDPGALQDLLDRVTVQETAFFRDPAQFEALADDVLPHLPHGTTIWSAGCSNGQEAYSVAMLLDELGHVGSRVLATDISTKALERARRGRYSEPETKGLSPARRARHLVAIDGAFEVEPELRARVEVAHHNLLSEPPPFAPGTCPVVLCRNVLIYFRSADVVSILDRIADWLTPGGWLFLGYSESLWQLSDRFELVRLGNAFCYQPRQVRGSRPPHGSPRVPHAVPHTGRPCVPNPRTVTPIPRARSDSELEPDSAAHRESAEFLALGNSALRAGDHAGAIAAFRKSAYLDPDQPVVHLELGLTLEAVGDVAASRRAFAVARALLDRRDPEGVEESLEGYRAGELARLLDQKLEGSR